MLGRRVVTALMTASMVGVLLVGATPAQAAPDPLLHVTKVTLNRTSVAVSGLNTVQVQVTVTGSYDSSDPLDANIPVVVWFRRTAGVGTLPYLVSTDLKLQAGTTIQNGVWIGPVNVPSTANGTMTVYGVTPGSYFGRQFQPMPVDPTPVAGPALAVTGLHPPKLTAKVIPPVVTVGSGFSITWAVTDATTGAAYGSGIRVLLGYDNECVEDAGGIIARTGTNGLVTHAYPASQAQGVNCLRIQGAPIDIAGLGVGVARLGLVSAAPSKPAAPVGTIVPVNGSVSGAPYNCPVVLQRLYGRTQWRGVSTAKVRQSGRFTVNAQPAYRGLIPYRVYFPKCYQWQISISGTFTIRGL
ncbi:hypothetical protein AB0E69_32945 [Kribbella sp. NPDC026611]|uniref:hypothetical protein n=1 Tax=Kribbella sp. NPDC026611 TaxID=3154911 RepID=UPI0033CB6FB2